MEYFKLKKCKLKDCQKEFKQYNSLKPFCSYVCELKYAETKECQAIHKSIELAVKKDELHKKLPKLLEKEINHIVRLIDYGQPCISTGTLWGDYIVNAGHYISVGSNCTLRYNLLNIFNQSKSDNFYKGGKGSNYSIRLKEIFGVQVRDKIEALPGKYKSIHLSDSEYLEKIVIAKQIVKELKEANRRYSTDERIILRIEFNERLGIYK
jgi:hypothetical protein